MSWPDYLQVVGDERSTDSVCVQSQRPKVAYEGDTTYVIKLLKSNAKLRSSVSFPGPLPERPHQVLDVCRHHGSGCVCSRSGVSRG